MSGPLSKVLLTSPIPPELREVLSAHHELVPMHRGSDRYPGYDVAVTTSVSGADAALFDQIPDLKLLLCNGTGVETIDLCAAAERGIIVRNTPDEVTEDTADFAIGLIYAVCRRICEADRFVRSGRWRTERMSPSNRASNRRIGIVGLGKIGQTLAAKACALGMSVSYFGPREKPEFPYRFFSDLCELAASVDVLVLTCPGGAATRHIINGHVLERLGPGGALINVSRGSVVDEESLVSALRNATIGAAALDVFSSEPEIDQRFVDMENVVLAPHYAAVTVDTRYAIAHALNDAIGELRAGKEILNAAAGATR